MGSLPNDTRDMGAAWPQKFGVAGAAVTSADATGNVAVTDAPGAARYLVVDDIVASSDTKMSLTFTTETAGTVIAVLYLPADGTACVTTRGKLKLGTANSKLMCDASAAGNIAVTVLWHAE